MKIKKWVGFWAYLGFYTTSNQHHQFIQDFNVMKFLIFDHSFKTLATKKS